MAITNPFSNPFLGIEKAFIGTVFAGLVGAESVGVLLYSLAALLGMGEFPPELEIQKAFVDTLLMLLAGFGVWLVPNSATPENIKTMEEALPEPLGIDPEDV